jgi:hypothetical protein
MLVGMYPYTIKRLPPNKGATKVNNQLSKAFRYGVCREFD